MYKLVNAGPSPYGRKVAVALHEKGLPFETIYDLPWTEATETVASSGRTIDGDRAGDDFRAPSSVTLAGSHRAAGAKIE